MLIEQYNKYCMLTDIRHMSHTRGALTTVSDNRVSKMSDRLSDQSIMADWLHNCKHSSHSHWGVGVIAIRWTISWLVFTANVQKIFLFAFPTQTTETLSSIGGFNHTVLLRSDEPSRMYTRYCEHFVL